MIYHTIESIAFSKNQILTVFADDLVPSGQIIYKRNCFYVCLYSKNHFTLYLHFRIVLFCACVSSISILQEIVEENKLDKLRKIHPLGGTFSISCQSESLKQVLPLPMGSTDQRPLERLSGKTIEIWIHFHMSRIGFWTIPLSQRFNASRIASKSRIILSLGTKEIWVFWTWKEIVILRRKLRQRFENMIMS